MPRLLHAIKRLSQDQYNLAQSQCGSSIIVSAPCLKQIALSLQFLNMYLFFQVTYQESHLEVNLMDLKIDLGCNCKWQCILAQMFGQCLHSLVVNAFELVISSIYLPGIEPLHIAFSIALRLEYPMTCQRNIPLPEVPPNLQRFDVA